MSRVNFVYASHIQATDMTRGNQSFEPSSGVHPFLLLWRHLFFSEHQQPGSQMANRKGFPSLINFTQQDGCGTGGYQHGAYIHKKTPPLLKCCYLCPCIFELRPATRLLSLVQWVTFKILSAKTCSSFDIMCTVIHTGRLSFSSVCLTNPTNPSTDHL